MRITRFVYRAGCSAPVASCTNCASSSPPPPPPPPFFFFFFGGVAFASNNMHCISLLATLAATSDTSVPSVYLEETFEVKEQLGLQYGAGVLCNAQECEMDPKSDCQRTQPPSGGDPSLAKYAIPGCEKPARFNLTLDLYTPIGAASLGPRPAFIAIHSGGYAVNNERGFAPTYEMTAACMCDQVLACPFSFFCGIRITDSLHTTCLLRCTMYTPPLSCFFCFALSFSSLPFLLKAVCV